MPGTQRDKASTVSSFEKLVSSVEKDKRQTNPFPAGRKETKCMTDLVTVIENMLMKVFNHLFNKYMLRTY